jgi:pseudouridine synthase
MEERIQKLIANSGLCSRRKAEELISEGKVLVNKKIAKLGDKASNEDIIEVNGKMINQKKINKYYIFNKPSGYTCTTAQFRNEINIYKLLPQTMHSLAIAGRLDKDSTGLILLTNDGDLLAKLTHPKYMHEKCYAVSIEVNPEITANQIIKELKNGVDIGEGDGYVQAKKIKSLSKNEFEVIITQGKKRQIRRMFSALGLKVKTLHRTAISSLQLGNLGPGKFRELSSQEVKSISK